MAGPEQVGLRSALEYLLQPPSEGDRERVRAAGILFISVCSSAAPSEHDRKRCVDLAYDLLSHWNNHVSAALRIEWFMRHFELRGRCLVEKGVGVDDPSVCEGDPDSGLLVVGSRMQAFIGRGLRSAVYRVGGACTVVIGGVPTDLYEIEAAAGGRRPGLTRYHERGAYVAVGPCSLGDLPRLAERAAALAEGEYSKIYKRCHQRWRSASSEELASLVRELTHRRHLDLLEELERGERP